MGRFPFEFSATSSSECNNFFLKFPKKRTASPGLPKFSEMFSWKFSFHSTFVPEFQEFSLEWFAFRKFNSF